MNGSDLNTEQPADGDTVRKKVVRRVEVVVERRELTLIRSAAHDQPVCTACGQPLPQTGVEPVSLQDASKPPIKQLEAGEQDPPASPA